MSSRRGASGPHAHVYEGGSYSLSLRMIRKFQRYVPGHVDQQRLEHLLAEAWAAAPDTTSPKVTRAMLETLRAHVNGRRL